MAVAESLGHQTNAVARAADEARLLRHDRVTLWRRRRLYMLCAASCDICHPTLMTISTCEQRAHAEV